MIQEKPALRIPAIAAIGSQIVIGLAVLWGLYAAVNASSLWGILLVVVGILDLIAVGGYVIVSPNDAWVLVFLGKYIGSVKESGFWWTNPLATKRRLSLKVRNFESGKLKVNDKDGNPIEIAAIVVWKVIETAEAVFNVESYENYVQVQSEAAVRNLAQTYPYDAHDDAVVSLRGNTQEIADKMKGEVQNRLVQAGVDVVEARISHLAYAPEIASAMLRRQQANAIIAARARIVEGAVSMVEMALDTLEKGGKVKLDEERKASMVSNLLVVLVSDKDAQPIVNTGTIYS